MQPYLDLKNNPWVDIELDLSVKTDVKCLIDTGFSGGIALPHYYFSLFKNKVPISTENYEFANGQQNEFAIYALTVRVNKIKVDVKVMFIESGMPLVGISFLKHFTFEMCIPKKQISLNIFKS